MPEGSKTTVPDGRRCELYYFTGKVLSSQKQKETQISSTTQHHANNYASTSVSSRTVDHHEFFLADEGGKERAFKTVDFDFPCREGQTLSVMWTIAEGKNEGPFLAVRNHNTQERHEASQASVAAWMEEPYTWGVIGVAVAIIIVLFFVNGTLGFLALIGLPIYGWWRKKSRAKSAAKSLLGGDALRQLDTQLAPLKPFAV
ncbi:MAG: hypothetical protein ABI640_04570 [Gammaproteobacteria bacterium]